MTSRSAAYDQLPPNEDLESCRCLCHNMCYVVTIIREGRSHEFRASDMGVDVRHPYHDVESWCCQRAVRTSNPDQRLMANRRRA